MAQATDAGSLVERLLADVTAFSRTRSLDLTGAFAVEQLARGTTISPGAPQEDDVCIVAFQRLA
jgi:hypothetical protein